MQQFRRQDTGTSETFRLLETLTRSPADEIRNCCQTNILMCHVRQAFSAMTRTCKGCNLKKDWQYTCLSFRHGTRQSLCCQVLTRAIFQEYVFVVLVSGNTFVYSSFWLEQKDMVLICVPCHFRWTGSIPCTIPLSRNTLPWLFSTSPRTPI